MRIRVLDLVGESGPMLGFEPTVLFEGPVDTATPEPMATDMLAALREALSNVARHARASHVDVVVAVDTSDVTLRVTDNGSARRLPASHGDMGSPT